MAKSSVAQDEHLVGSDTDSKVSKELKKKKKTKTKKKSTTTSSKTSKSKSKEKHDGTSLKSFSLTVRKQPYGETFWIQVEPSTQISSCKKKIQRMRGIPSGNIRLAIVSSKSSSSSSSSSSSTYWVVDDDKSSYDEENFQERTLKSLGIDGGNKSKSPSVFLELAAISLYVRLPSGQIIFLEDAVDVECTVDHLEELISSRLISDGVQEYTENISESKRLRLYHEDVSLQRGHPIYKYRILDRAVLQLMIIDTSNTNLALTTENEKAKQPKKAKKKSGDEESLISKASSKGEGKKKPKKKSGDEESLVSKTSSTGEGKKKKKLKEKSVESKKNGDGESCVSMTSSTGERKKKTKDKSKKTTEKDESKLTKSESKRRLTKSDSKRRLTKSDSKKRLTKSESKRRLTKGKKKDLQPDAQENVENKGFEDNESAALEAKMKKAQEVRKQLEASERTVAIDSEEEDEDKAKTAITTEAELVAKVQADAEACRKAEIDRQQKEAEAAVAKAKAEADAAKKAKDEAIAKAKASAEAQSKVVAEAKKKSEEERQSKENKVKVKATKEVEEDIASQAHEERETAECETEFKAEADATCEESVSEVTASNQVDNEEDSEAKASAEATKKEADAKAKAAAEAKKKTEESKAKIVAAMKAEEEEAARAAAEAKKKAERVWERVEAKAKAKAAAKKAEEEAAAKAKAEAGLEAKRNAEAKTVIAPAGKLGLMLADKIDSTGCVVLGVQASSSLKDQLSVGDWIVAIDGEDVTRMTYDDIITIICHKDLYDRELTVVPNNNSSFAENANDDDETDGEESYDESDDENEGASGFWDFVSSIHSREGYFPSYHSREPLPEEDSPSLISSVSKSNDTSVTEDTAVMSPLEFLLSSDKGEDDFSDDSDSDSASFHGEDEDDCMNSFFVITPDLTPMRIEIDATKGTSDIKNEVSEASGIPVSDLRLVNCEDGVVVTDNFRPSSGDVLTVMPSTVIVKLPDNSELELSVFPNAQVSDLKDYIEERTDTNSSKQILSSLETDCELDDAAFIQSDCNLQLTTRSYFQKRR
mmetsp:Transcript_13836/g.38912  ORF Transcript_13836/g.38912 Transcript_13836/m.38912 type:complete len:1050 (+) Transcript_13836:199-3348(+)